MSASVENERNCLLIAMPQLADPNFFRTVSLMASFDDRGAFGLILNRPVQATLDQILQKDMPLENAGDIPVYYGGPVQVNSLWFLHAYAEFNQKGIQVLPNLFLTTDLETVQQVLEKHKDDKPAKFRFFLGYAGWSPGQLENEIAMSSWVTAPIDISELFNCEPQSYWDTALHRLGISDPGSLVSPVSSGTAH